MDIVETLMELYNNKKAVASRHNCWIGHIYVTDALVEYDKFM